MTQKSENIKKTASVKVALQVPEPEPNDQFLLRRVNTEMAFCGDIETIETNDTEIKLVMASGQLTVFIACGIKDKLPLAVDALINKNVCVRGYLSANKDGFEMHINKSAQIFLSGH